MSLPLTRTFNVLAFGTYEETPQFMQVDGFRITKDLLKSHTSSDHHQDKSMDRESVYISFLLAGQEIGQSGRVHTFNIAAGMPKEARDAVLAALAETYAQAVVQAQNNQSSYIDTKDASKPVIVLVAAKP